MAQILTNLFKGAKSSASPVPSADSDFADFAEEPSPSPSPFTPVPGGATLSGQGGPSPTGAAVPYTKWYNVHERHSLSEFRVEGFILVAVVVFVLLHLFGASINRSKARRWIRANAPPLQAEFALVGYGGEVPGADADSEKSGSALAKALEERAARGDSDSLLREKSLFEFATYATGRQNVAFVDVRLTLVKRFNPLMTLAEAALGFVSESFGQLEDAAEAILYPFDGREAQLVPGTIPGQAELRARDGAKSGTFDGFVWAIVNKERMKKVRDDRYDVSLTYTKDHPKLPAWLTVMSESAEITDALLTPELARAAERAGELLDYLIISDQPVEKPKSLNETEPRKRVFLKYQLPEDDQYDRLLPIFGYFLRMADQLAQSGRFRPEVMRKVRNVREEMSRQIQKADRNEKAEERAQEREKARKAKRDQELSGLDAKAQKKYLEREREKEMRKSMKKQTTRA